MSEPERANSDELGVEPGESADRASQPVSRRDGESLPPAGEPTLEERLAATQAEAVNDQLLRTAADFDNFRQRSRKEGEDDSRVSSRDPRSRRSSTAHRNWLFRARS